MRMHEMDRTCPRDIKKKVINNMKGSKVVGVKNWQLVYEGDVSGRLADFGDMNVFQKLEGNC